MRRRNYVVRLLLGFSILLFMTVFTNPGFAQGDKAPQQLYTFSYVQVKSGMNLEFEEFLKNAIPTFQKMGLTEIYTSKTANFGMSDKYVFVVPLQDPAVMDAELFQPQSSIPVGIVSVISAIQRMVVSSHDFMVIPQPDLNIPLAEDYEVKLIVNFTVNLVPGREEDFKKELKKVVGALGKTKVKGVLVGKVGLGGNMDQFIVSIFYDSFKEMMENEPAIQKELASLDLKPLNGVVSSRESEVLIQIPELCLQPAAQ